MAAEVHQVCQLDCRSATTRFKWILHLGRYLNKQLVYMENIRRRL